MNSIKQKIISTIEYDLKVFVRMSKRIAIADFLQKENNQDYKKIAFEMLNDTLVLTKVDSWFLASRKTEYFFFNNKDREYDNRENTTTLSKNDERDGWFYYTIESKTPYNLNIDHDKSINKTKLWINIPVVLNGQNIGVIGGGLNFDTFVNEHISQNKNVKSLLIDENGGIFLNDDKKNMTYQLKTTDNSKKSLFLIL